MSKNKTVRNAFFAIFCFFTAVSLAYAEICSSSGQVQYKYTASGCSYTTQSRTCCATTGAWSDWGGTCPSCSSDQCWNGSICEDKEALQSTCQSLIPNTVSGNLTRTAECVSGSVWKYGEWDGECVCAEGYMPDELSNITCHEARYNWKILKTQTDDYPYNECEDAAYSDTYLYKWLYGIEDSELIINGDCTKWIEKYGTTSNWFYIWRGDCYQYLMECVKS